jgi:DnaA regulatory inactivator Hda
MSDMPRQLAFDLPVRRDMTAEDFVVTPANRAALEAVRRFPSAAQVPRPATPLLVLVGAPGSGKTHLAEIWRARTGALRAAPEDIREENLAALLSRKHLVIDDMPGASGGLDERALFHLLNMARETGAALLFASRLFPAAWPVRLPDLRSRLKAALVATIEPADDALLEALLVKHFADRQLRVGRDVISYLLSRMERTPAAAARLVAAIDRAALAEKARISRPFVARVLRRLENMPVLP